jgi:DNA repair protein RadC
MENLPIKSLAEADRPREKLLEKGRHVLSDAELIAVLLGSGSRDESAIELAKRIFLNTGNDLAVLSKFSVRDFQQFKGVGEAKAVALVAALELGRRRHALAGSVKTKVVTSADAFEMIKGVFQDLPHEEFWILLLNRGNRILRKEFISRGGLSGTVVDIRMVFKPAIQHLACSMILCHNHPSGNLQPSEADMKITRQLKEAGQLLDIPVLDHLIVSDCKYYSFADEGAM